MEYDNYVRNVDSNLSGDFNFSSIDSEHTHFPCVTSNT